MGRYLNHWTDYLSYVILHELIHLLFDYEDEELRRPVWDEAFKYEIKKAYRYYGAKALLEQRPSLVDTNVDSLGMIIVGK
ncbi:uncharacterized protein N7459_005950 [Penicillium hispanicum]|uniref:uncharacterized protein n=1 Tax=Penicillium hispanicum TaxID=1080232 RepID=UPI00254200DB|nr:uncharacterized protein N7459_005950 [Penicillium hispanicum]KAJ5579965.1 hypothetical protein N7459_005950 [Penicillium hispanicum]